MSITVLPGVHISPETAYVVADYPFGFRLRCQIRYWLEVHPKHGVRCMSQTSNPKVAGLVWNKPKASTYSRFGGALYLDDKGHVHHAGLTEYSDGAEAKRFSDIYRAGVPAAALEMLDRWVAAKLAYDANRSKSDSLNVGVAEARKAFVATPGAVKYGHTTREITVRYLENIGFPVDVTLPANTRVVSVMGGMGPSWAVDDVALLVRLTGNEHDPKHRYCFVPDDAVAAGEG